MKIEKKVIDILIHGDQKPWKMLYYMLKCILVNNLIIQRPTAKSDYVLLYVWHPVTNRVLNCSLK
jgi:hypothetical protein